MNPHTEQLSLIDSHIRKPRQAHTPDTRRITEAETVRLYFLESRGMPALLSESAYVEVEPKES